VEKIKKEDHSPRSDRDEETLRFNATLFKTIDTLEKNRIAYALIGGVASRGLGRPRVTHDIDIFLRPDDAGLALAALEREGFETEKRDPHWLYKAWHNGILVDIIFKSTGDIYFDEEIRNRSKAFHYHGREIPAVAPEDFILIKSAVHSEVGPHHWHDALAVLSHAEIDWQYLLKRSRSAPRRLLSLFIYAQSNDIWVPNDVIFKLFNQIFGQQSVTTSSEFPKINLLKTKIEKGEPSVYIAGHIQEAITADEKTGDQDIKVHVSKNKVLLRGEVSTQEQKERIKKVVKTIAPSLEIENQVSIRNLPPPEGSEAVL
jgi:predicted nucleotidyltransferase